MLEICDAATGKKILSYPASLPRDASQSSLVVAWSPNGEIIASAAAKSGHSLQFRHASTGQPLYYFAGPFPSVAVWSPDGKMIATGGARGQSPRVLDSNTDQALLIIPAQLPLLPGFELIAVGSALPHTLSWSPDGKYLACATANNQVQIWDVARKSHVYTYDKHSSPVLAVAWSPNSSYIASASYDKTVHVWAAL